MLRVRLAKERDSRTIHDWRNDKLTRQMSHIADKVDWSTHCQWFALSIKDEKRLLVICETSNTREKVAVVRFDVEKERALISINLAPEMRGKKMAKKCLRNALALFFVKFPQVHFIEAEIKSYNIASRRTFEGVGFQCVIESEGVCHYAHHF